MKARLFLLTVSFAGIAIAGPSPTQPLTVSAQGNGLVTSNPAGINCPTDCDETYVKGTTVFLTASANPYGKFLRWEGACTGTAPTCRVKMAAPRAVTAVFDPAVVKPPLTLLKTGQTDCWGESYGTGPIDCASSGQDGEYQAGVAPPVPRYIDNGDGTITDTATKLTWMRRLQCFPQLSWMQALTAANNLAEGQCDLTDGSVAGDWRLPNANELNSLASFAHPRVIGQDFPESPFLYVRGQNCGNGDLGMWSSTTLPGQPELAYVLFQWTLRPATKTASGIEGACAFPVKGGR